MVVIALVAWTLANLYVRYGRSLVTDQAHGNMIDTGLDITMALFLTLGGISLVLLLIQLGVAAWQLQV
jgi:hypothetical protein